MLSDARVRAGTMFKSWSAMVGAMTSDDLLPMIWDALGADRLTTLEATDRLEDLFKYRCPDDLAKTLMKFRKAGLIKGEISMDRGTSRTARSRPPGTTCSPGTSTAS